MFPALLCCTNIISQWGGVDKSDQYISYHNHKVTRKTYKYWKTLFFHLIDIALVNSHILYTWKQLQNSKINVTENEFRDALILQIISTYGKKEHSEFVRTTSSYIQRHGSKLYPHTEKSRCASCHLHSATSFTQRKCPDCPLNPALCQTLERDCHSEWHDKSFSVIRNLWYSHRRIPESADTPTRGRPKGSINRRRKRGAYRSK